MQDRDSVMTLRRARVICEMEAACFSEGIGPDSAELLRLVFSLYPELREEFSYLPAARPPEKDQP